MTAPGRAEPVSVLGTLADGVVGSGDGRGLLRVETAGIEIDWWVGADDGWSDADGGVHTIRPGIAPAIEARRRVPGGEVVLRAYATAGAGAPQVVAELENASPAPVVVAWVVRGAPGYRVGRCAIDGSSLLIDQRARVELPGSPSRWAVATRRVGVRDAVVGGNAARGRFEPVETRRGDLEVAVLFPIAHRTRTRISVTTAGTGDPASPIPVAKLPSLADVERGWEAAAERGMRVEIPDATMQVAVDAARSTLLLGTVGARRRDRVVARAADAWGIGAVRHRFEPGGARLRGAVAGEADPWPRLRATAAESGSTPQRCAEWLAAVRSALLHVERDQIDLLRCFPVEWLGLPVAVHDAPTGRGLVSFALRWHGVRPALLWDVPTGLRVRIPGLDPTWEGTGAGEALLAEIDPTRLLALGSAGAHSRPSQAGVAIDEPGSFL